MKRSILLVISVFFPLFLSGQDFSFPDSMQNYFDRQLTKFPQEKVYLHTDRSIYLPGEKIWFRAYLVDAARHSVIHISRYVYAELIDPLDSVVARVKIRPTDDAFHGYITVPEILPGGQYTLRAYTRFMENQDADYFYTKSIRIGDASPGLITPETYFSFDSPGVVTLDFRFTDAQRKPVRPDKIAIRVNGRDLGEFAGVDGFARTDFSLPDTGKHRVLYLEVVYNQRTVAQYIPIPRPVDDFDVAFFPEGGQLVEGTPCRVAFKAMQSGGSPVEVKGEIYDPTGAQVAGFTSQHLGMGSFLLVPQEGMGYYAVCRADSIVKRFELPRALPGGCALKTVWAKDKLLVSVQRGRQYQGNLYLLAHTRGIVHQAVTWDHTRSYIAFDKEYLPSGVLQFLLLDANRMPLSERLVFVDNSDRATVDYQTDKTHYAARSHVSNQLKITVDGVPAAGTGLSVAVTDDSQASVDTTTNIIAYLLLASELKGYIEQPASYMGNPGALDLLMMTQGWRRYDVPAVARGEIARPAVAPEGGMTIAGQVTNMEWKKPMADVKVNLVNIGWGYFEETKSGATGEFAFYPAEFPDSTHYMIQAPNTKKNKELALTVQDVTYPPAVGLPAKRIIRREGYDDNPWDIAVDYEPGMPLVRLSEVTITARRPVKNIQAEVHPPNHTITEEQIIKRGVTDIRSALAGIPGLEILNNGAIYIRQNKGVAATILLDGMVVNSGGDNIRENKDNDLETIAHTDIIDLISIFDIDRIEVYKTRPSFVMFEGGGGVIVIYTKNGKEKPSTFHPRVKVKDIVPLGYQQPAAFYSPRYDTSASLNNKPDLRKTIYWNPDVKADDVGMASFEFYTADTETTYTVIIEGMTEDGKIIRHVGKIFRK